MVVKRGAARARTTSKRMLIAYMLPDETGRRTKPVHGHSMGRGASERPKTEELGTCG
jgi:hypothetical protein